MSIVIGGIADSESPRLRVAPTALFFPTELSFQIVRLEWSFEETVNLVDWIGLFEVVCGQKVGQIDWKISSSFMPSGNRRSNVCFRYYSGITGALRAESPPMLVFTDALVVVESIKCKNLKISKGGYLAKVQYRGEISHKTAPSPNAEWPNLDFAFPADRSQELLFIVRERFWSGNRTVGEANISIAEIVHQSNGELGFSLRPSNGSQFSAQIIIQCRFVGGENETIKVPMPRLSADRRNGNPSASSSSSSSASALSSSLYSNSSTCRTDSSKMSITQLPKGWEVRVDRYGRLIYVDHQRKRTTWNPPTVLERQIDADSAHRFGNARRTVMNSSQTSAVSNNNNSMERTSRPILQNSPLCFLQRSDFSNLLNKNPIAAKIYSESNYLKHVIHRLRRNRANFEDFERNAEFVEFLNSFADKTQPLPFGWEMARRTDQFSQQLFIDHNRRKITLIDPRLPAEVKRRTLSEPPQRFFETDQNSNIVLDIMTRSEEIQSLIRKRFPEIAEKICEKIRNINAVGESALIEYANDVDFIRAISILDESVPKTAVKSEMEEKAEYFYTALQRAGYGQGPTKIRFRLRRSHLLSDAFDKILSVDSNQLRRCRMMVTFDEEEGLDYGGPSRELFFLLSRELFNPYYGLFEYSANDSYTVQISPMSKFVDNHLQWMELCGRVLGLALVHRCLIDTFFTRAFYKLMIGMSYSIEDLQSMDKQFYNSLKWIRENPVTPEMDLTFSTTAEVGGEISEFELLPDGKSLLVNDGNKEEFMSLMTRWRIERNVEDQMRALLRGLYSIIERNYLSVFNSNQLELILSGKMEIDLEDWRENTEYKGGYHDSHILINWFWSCVYEMNNSERLKLLQFVTGTTSIPHEGFRALRGSDGLKRFSIERWGEEESLPRAHTCFNRLDLPSYRSLKILKEKLTIAINESSSYAIE